MTQGYFFIALGPRYIEECAILSRTIRKHGDTRPISLLIHQHDEAYARSFNLFDHCVYFEPSGPMWSECVTGFEKYCLYPRLRFDLSIPYDETIIVDSDVLCQSSPDPVWAYMSSRPCPVGMMGRRDDPSWHWGTIREVSDAFGKHVPHVHGGFFYLRKESKMYEFFLYARELFTLYDTYRCKRYFRGGKVDEIIFAMAHAKFDWWPIEFDEYPVMTFNYTPEVVIPSRLQTEGNQNIELSGYIPFVHMFDKMEGANFQSLYRAIMGEK